MNESLISMLKLAAQTAHAVGYTARVKMCSLKFVQASDDLGSMFNSDVSE